MQRMLCAAVSLCRQATLGQRLGDAGNEPRSKLCDITRLNLDPGQQFEASAWQGDRAGRLAS